MSDVSNRFIYIHSYRTQFWIGNDHRFQSVSAEGVVPSLWYPLQQITEHKYLLIFVFRYSKQRNTNIYWYLCSVTANNVTQMSIDTCVPLQQITEHKYQLIFVFHYSKKRDTNIYWYLCPVTAKTEHKYLLIFVSRYSKQRNTNIYWYLCSVTANNGTQISIDICLSANWWRCNLGIFVKVSEKERTILAAGSRKMNPL